MISAILWAINGNIGSYLFTNKEMNPEHLTMFRLVFSGALLLIYQYKTNKDGLYEIFKNKSDLYSLIFFAFCGLLAMQYGYLAAIRHSNPATATVIQSVAPFIIVIITAVKRKKLPSKRLIISSVLAFIGVFFLVTHGRIDKLAITTLALLFGIVSAFGAVFYNLSSIKLQEKYSILFIMAWAMIFAGIGFSIVLRPWRIPFIVDLGSILGIIYVVLFGTLCPFVFYLFGSKIIGPQRASIITLLEPVISTFIVVVFMKGELLGFDFIGIIMVLVGLLALSTNKEKEASA